MMLHYKDLLQHTDRQKTEGNYPRPLAKLGMPAEEQRGNTPSKAGTIEKPLLREESIDSTLKKSAEKNLFGDRRLEDAFGISSQKKDGFSAARGFDDLGAQYFPNDMIDVSALFRAADHLAGPINMSWRQQAPQSFLEQSMLLDELIPKYESMIMDRTHGKARNTDGKSLRGQNTTGVTMMMNSMVNVTGRFTTDRKVRFDQDILLSSSKKPSEENTSSLDWMKSNLQLKPKDEYLKETWEDSEVAELISKVNGALRNPDLGVEQQRGNNFEDEHGGSMPSFDHNMLFGGGANEPNAFGEAANPLRLSTVAENTLEDFGTQGFNFINPEYEAPDTDYAPSAFEQMSGKRQKEVTDQVLSYLEEEAITGVSFKKFAKKRLTTKADSGKLELVDSIQAMLKLVSDGVISMSQPNCLARDDIKITVLEFKMYE